MEKDILETATLLLPKSCIWLYNHNKSICYISDENEPAILFKLVIAVGMYNYVSLPLGETYCFTVFMILIRLPERGLRLILDMGYLSL